MFLNSFKKKDRNKSRYTMKEQIYKAMKLKYEAEIEYHQTTLQIYFERPVAIGEHPQHLEEIDTLLEKIGSTNDKLEALKQFMKTLDKQ